MHIWLNSVNISLGREMVSLIVSNKMAREATEVDNGTNLSLLMPNPSY